MPELFFLFGGTKPFTPPPWETTDDRIRGGSSQSYFSPVLDNGASFNGTLDIKTLGGAGFASQFSPTIDNGNLSAYDGLEISLGKGDGKVYTLIIKDEKSPGKRLDGRKEASINWEVDFEAGKDGGIVWKPWTEFKATYRGKEKEDAGSLREEHVERVGIMMRSYFGTQEGNFQLELRSIAARKRPGKSSL